MTYTLNDIEQLALTHLSAAELDALADRIRRHVHGGETEGEEDPEFLAELDRRMRAVDDGTVMLHSSEEVHAYLKQKYGWS